jgi:CHAD domain-containing protein
MNLEPDSLPDSAPRVVRTVGRELLARLREKSEDLGVDGDGDALHDFRVAVRRLRSWMRAFDDDLAGTVRPKARRRLKRIADATRASRDFEVHIDWLDRFAKSRRGRYQRATEWLVERARARKARADLKLQEVLNADFERTVAQLSQGLAHYVVDLDEPPEPFGTSLATLIREHAESARQALSRILSVGDRAEAHRARIAAKRLRYLLEPLSDAGVGAEPLVERIAQLQDDLGALHDAQIFGSEIARLLAKVLAATTRESASRNGDKANGEARSIAVDRAEALRAISQRLYRDELRRFRHIKETWLDSGADSLWTDAESVAEKIEVGARPS